MEPPQTPQTPQPTSMPQSAPPSGSAPVIAQVPGTNAPQAVYLGYVHQRSELRDQLSRLRDQRQDISNQLQGDVAGTDRRGLEQQITQIDQRMADVNAQIAKADAQVATAAAIPGAVVDPPPYVPQGPPDEVYILSGIFMFVVLLPLSVALARRIWKRSAAAISSLPQDIYDRFARVEQSLDAIAIEVERVGEGQRYVTRMLAERPQALGAGPPERIELGEREKQREKR
jgi:hypothetical protein